MKEFWAKYNKIILLLFFWRCALFFIELVSVSIIPLHPGYNGPIPWANHDGIFYLGIAQFGYKHLTEAFFPLYPIVIAVFQSVPIVPIEYTAAGVSFISFSIAILMLYNKLEKVNKQDAKWTILLLIAFPTSFFFSAVYTEGLFFLLTILIVYCADHKKWFWCGVLGALASATKLFGVLLFIYVFLEYIRVRPKKILLKDLVSIFIMPLGLVFYMAYLYMRTGDALYFMHMQPLFGANRSSGLVFPPQVVWRYLKILFTAYLQPTPASYFISVLEFVCTIIGYILLGIGWKMKIKMSYLIYGISALTVPALTGTFSSMPRYVLSVFPLFLIIGSFQHRILRYALLGIFVILQIVLSAMFLRGWFVA